MKGLLQIVPSRLWRSIQRGDLSAGRRVSRWDAQVMRETLEQLRSASPEGQPTIFKSAGLLGDDGERRPTQVRQRKRERHHAFMYARILARPAADPITLLDLQEYGRWVMQTVLPHTETRVMFEMCRQTLLVGNVNRALLAKGCQMSPNELEVYIGRLEKRHLVELEDRAIRVADPLLVASMVLVQTRWRPEQGDRLRVISDWMEKARALMPVDENGRDIFDETAPRGASEVIHLRLGSSAVRRLKARAAQAGLPFATYASALLVRDARRDPEEG
jgi:hypothetical protein